MMIIRIIRITFFEKVFDCIFWLIRLSALFFFLSLTPSLPEGSLCHVWWRLERVFDSKLSLSFICFGIWPSYWTASPGPIVAFTKQIQNIVLFYLTHSGFHTLLINHTLLCYSQHPPFNPAMLLCRRVCCFVVVCTHYQFISHSLGFYSLDFLKILIASKTWKKSRSLIMFCGVSWKHWMYS